MYPHPTPSGDLVDWRQPAKRLNLKHRAFWQAVRDQGIPHYRINARVIRFRMAEIEEWLEFRKAGGNL
ncbi:helix-turn-helix transcriptional regulator [Verrucomicrobiota bacterium sgz303538]